MESTVREMRIMIDTNHFRECVHFYKTILGYPERAVGEPDIAMFDVGPHCVIELFEEEIPRRAQGASLSLEVSDVKALWDSLHDQADVVFPLRHNSWGDTSFAVLDPAGTKLIFYTPDTEK